MQHHALDDETLFVQSTSLVVSDPSVEVDTTFGGDKTFFGGLKSALFSGEGLVCAFSGEGTVRTQTRSSDAFLSWPIPKLPTQSSSN